MDQTVFETVYRGRQSALHHLAYMRMGKVLLALRSLAGAGIDLSDKTIFDYGFDDFEVRDYLCHPAIAAPVAV